MCEECAIIEYMIITAGKYKGRKVIAPDENITRPTLSKIRESIFSVLYSHIDFEGKFFLDCFAGSGIMGLEALSRGFVSAVAIEKNPKVARILKQNYENIDLVPNLIIGDALKKLPQLNTLGKKFDVIYIDPPYKSGIYEHVLEIINENKLLNERGIIVLEHSQKVDFSTFELFKQKKYADKFITFLEQ